MKTETRKELRTRAILLSLVALGFAAGACWLMVSPPATTSQPPAPPGLVPLPAPLVRLRPILPIGPVTTARDATARAVIAANDTALRDYHVEPFTDADANATFDGRSWSWRKRVGFGRGDLEAEVRIAQDGTVEEIIVRYMTQQLEQAMVR
jgi:hypothetical protein